MLQRNKSEPIVYMEVLQMINPDEQLAKDDPEDVPDDHIQIIMIQVVILEQVQVEDFKSEWTCDEVT